MRRSVRSLFVVLALLAPPILLTAGPVSAVPSASHEALAQKAASAGKLQIVVEIKPGRGPAVADIARSTGGTAVRTFELMPYVTLTGTAATIRALASDANVVQITEDIAVPPTLNSSLPVINADDVHALGFRGAGRTVAILDTGIDADHPFFRDNNGGNPGTSRILSQACFSHDNGTNQFTLCPNGAVTDLTNANVEGLANCLNGPTNICAHGSHVAGIAAGDGAGVVGAPTAGVAPDAGIIAIQVFTRFTDPGPAGCNGPAPCVLSYTSDQIAGLNRVGTLAGANAAWGVTAANLSLGGGQFFSACDGGPQAAQKTAIDTLLAAGIATVIAAGNNGFLNSVSSPGCISTAVTVGSTTDADAVSGFSNRGLLLDLFAPGSSIDSSVPDDAYANFQGTSMATPHVVGAFAVLRQVAPGRTIAQLLNDLRTTGVPITYSTGGTKTATTPRIDLLAAFNSIAGSADLSIAKACPSGPVPPTATVACTITVTNNGPTDAQAVVVTDTPGPGLTISPTPVPGGGGFTCNILGGGASLSCTRAVLPPGTYVITFAVVVGDKASPGATLTNNASVSSTTPDPNPGNNTGSATITVVSCTINSNAAEVPGTAGNDVICGGSASQEIAALGGNDVVFGGGGNDHIAGGTGDDILLGGDGDDQLAGEENNDTLIGQNGSDFAAGGIDTDTCNAEFEAGCEI